MPGDQRFEDLNPDPNALPAESLDRAGEHINATGQCRNNDGSDPQILDDKERDCSPVSESGSPATDGVPDGNIHEVQGDGGDNIHEVQGDGSDNIHEVPGGGDDNIHEVAGDGTPSDNKDDNPDNTSDDNNNKDDTGKDDTGGLDPNNNDTGRPSDDDPSGHHPNSDGGMPDPDSNNPGGPNSNIGFSSVVMRGDSVVMPGDDGSSDSSGHHPNSDGGMPDPDSNNPGGPNSNIAFVSQLSAGQSGEISHGFWDQAAAASGNSASVSSLTAKGFDLAIAGHHSLSSSSEPHSLTGLTDQGSHEPADNSTAGVHASDAQLAHLDTGNVQVDVTSHFSDFSHQMHI
jgi:hypothetical protein